MTNSVSLVIEWWTTTVENPNLEDATVQQHKANPMVWSVTNAQNRQWLRSPIHVSIKWQWWSKVATHLLQNRQWWLRSGGANWHIWHCLRRIPQKRGTGSSRAWEKDGKVVLLLVQRVTTLEVVVVTVSSSSSVSSCSYPSKVRPSSWQTCSTTLASCPHCCLLLILRRFDSSCRLVLVGSCCFCSSFLLLSFVDRIL